MIFKNLDKLRKDIGSNLGLHQINEKAVFFSFFDYSDI